MRFLFVLILLFAGRAEAQFGMLRDQPFLAASPVVPCPDHSVYLIKQDFENSTIGYDNCETWTESGSGTIDPEYTGVVLQGTQSLRILQIAQAGETFTTFTAQDEVWCYFLLRPVLNDATFTKVIFQLYESGASVRLQLFIDTSRRLSVAGNPGGSATTVDALSLNTTYHVWVHQKKGTGANAIADVAFSTDGIRPTSGNKFAQFTNGGVTQQIGKMSIARDAGSNTQEYIFDKVRADDVQIGDSPP